MELDWEDVTFHEFLQWVDLRGVGRYGKKSTAEEKSSGDESGKDSEEDNVKKLKRKTSVKKEGKDGENRIVQNKAGEVWKVNKRRVIVNLGRLEPHSEPLKRNAFCYAVMKLFSAWRSEAELPKMSGVGEESPTEVLKKNLEGYDGGGDTSLKRVPTYIGLQVEMGAILSKLQSFGTFRDRPAFGVAELEEPREDGEEKPSGGFRDVLGVTAVVTEMWSEVEFKKRTAQLNYQQRSVLDVIAQHAQQEEGALPLHLFVSGEGGTGKSEILHCAEQALARVQGEGKVAIGAFTGAASFMVGGQTLHSLLSLPIFDEEGPPPRSQKLYGPLKAELQKFWYGKKMLLIDEISMVSADLLNWIDLRLREIMNSNEPFGGLSVVAFGDLQQLCPVKGSEVFGKVQGGGGTVHPWTTHFLAVELEENFRARTDPEWIGLLRRCRVGDKSRWEEDEAFLQSRVVDVSAVPEGCPAFFGTREEVKMFNAEKVANLRAQGVQVETAESFDVMLEAVDLGGRSARDVRPKHDEQCKGLPAELHLAVGIPVMLRDNEDTRDGLVNGALGKVTDWNLQEGWVAVKFNDARVGAKRRHFHDGVLEDGSILIGLLYKRFPSSEGHAMASYQYPLVNAWATTVHKAQGRSEDVICTALGAKMGQSKGMAYTALSRVRRGVNVMLTEFTSKAFEVSRKALVEMARLRVVTESAMKTKRHGWSDGVYSALRDALGSRGAGIAIGVGTVALAGAAAMKIATKADGGDFEPSDSDEGGGTSSDGSEEEKEEREKRKMNEVKNTERDRRMRNAALKTGEGESEKKKGAAPGKGIEKKKKKLSSDKNGKGVGDRQTAEYLSIPKLTWKCNSCFMAAAIHLLTCIPAYATYWESSYTWTKLRDSRKTLFKGEYWDGGKLKGACAAEFLRKMYDKWHMLTKRRTVLKWNAQGAVFGVRLGSSVACSVCDGPARVKDEGWSATMDVEIEPGASMQTLVDRFVFPECLEGDEEVECEHCMMKTPHVKTMRVEEGRGFVVVALKRFNDYGDKVEWEVELANTISIDTVQGKLKGQVVGFVEHIGNSLDDVGNHYRAYLKKETGWWEADGDTVERQSDALVKEKEVYMALYKFAE